LNSNIYAHGRPQRRARGALAPPGRPRPAKNSMFLDFFGKNSIFYVFLGKKLVLSPFPPGKFLLSPGKKSADAHVYACHVLKEIRFHGPNKEKICFRGPIKEIINELELHVISKKILIGILLTTKVFESPDLAYLVVQLKNRASIEG
jgi:hypothetical protein